MILSLFLQFLLLPPAGANRPAYYVSPAGSDHNPGTRKLPFQTLEKVNNLDLAPGTSVFLMAGQTFTGPLLLDSLDRGTPDQPIRVTSYGNGRAFIDGRNADAVTVRNTRHMVIKNLTLKGAGRKNGNTGRGILLSGVSDIRVESVETSGFQKAGVEVQASENIAIERVFAHDNGFAGIAVTGLHYPQRDNREIRIAHCRAENNPGDPTVLDNHSGNGIIVGLAERVMIEYCTATNNGWDMPWKGNGPVGIWAWESDYVTIQHCISYRNATSPGARDGGGFDLDGGVTYSVVQYNLSYENQGYGYGIFQYPGALPFHDNIFRYNISIDDGNVVHDGANVLWWNGDDDPAKFRDCYFYNNLLLNRYGAPLSIVDRKNHCDRFFFCNNILIGKNELLKGGELRNEQFYGNAWWSLDAGFNLNGFGSLREWAAASGKETLRGHLTGVNQNPFPELIFQPNLTDPEKMRTLTALKLPPRSPLRNLGLDLEQLFGIPMARRDFFGNLIPKGSRFISIEWKPAPGR